MYLNLFHTKFIFRPHKKESPHDKRNSRVLHIVTKQCSPPSLCVFFYRKRKLCKLNCALHRLVTSKMRKKTKYRMCKRLCNTIVRENGYKPYLAPFFSSIAQIQFLFFSVNFSLFVAVCLYLEGIGLIANMSYNNINEEKSKQDA